MGAKGLCVHGRGPVLGGLLKFPAAVEDLNLSQILLALGGVPPAPAYHLDGQTFLQLSYLEASMGFIHTPPTRGIGLKGICRKGHPSLIEARRAVKG